MEEMMRLVARVTGSDMMTQGRVLTSCKFARYIASKVWGFKGEEDGFLLFWMISMEKPSLVGTATVGMSPGFMVTRVIWP
ncbi:hypothetical protein AAC387_Pa09g0821 [Persea americana]